MSTKKERSEAPQEAIELYNKLIATNPEIERKGDTIPYTSHNGNMFTALSKSGTVRLRLGGEEREKFMKKYKTTQPVEYGVLLKEYVSVPDSLLKKTKELSKYLELSFEYVKTLKPKPAAKKQK